MNIYADNFFIKKHKTKLNLKYFLKRIIMFFLQIFYQIIIFFSIKKIKRKKKYLAICGIFKNECLYMKEWIEYHLLLGVDHFYLYNNFSDDNYLEVLEPYIKNGVVDLIEWPVKQGQISAYEDCYKKYSSQTNWLCFLDFDEFICLYNENNIKDWLKKYEKYPSIIAYWKMFGTSGKVKREKKLLIEDLTISWEKLYDVGKVFLNTKFKPCFIYHHFLKSEFDLLGLKIKIPTVNEYGKFINFNLNRIGFFNRITTIQINHYWSKTYSEYIEKKIPRGDVFFKNREYTLEDFYFHELENKNQDLKIFRFIIKLKERMGIKEFE